ncbi:MAG: hypothetical protein WCD76_02350, partial [Pyrinomonadaceae bacterium]
MNKLRTLLLSILLLALVAGGLPLTYTLARWAHHAAAGNYKRHRHHSRAWWRRHRARQRARRERAMLLKVNQSADATVALSFGSNTSLVAARDGSTFMPIAARGAQFPFGLVAPHAWNGA